MIASTGYENAILYSFFRSTIITLAKTEILAEKMRSRSSHELHQSIFGDTRWRASNKDWLITQDSPGHAPKE